MSNFEITARSKETKEVVRVLCLDDYFGNHRYGYVPHPYKTSSEALTEEEFYRKYEVMSKDAGEK